MNLAKDQKTTRARRILVVDDEPLLVRMLQRVLETNGYDVLGAADGHAALAVLAETTVDLVLSDVRMPGMDGPSLLAELRRLPSPPPLVFLTGYGAYTDAQLKAMGAVQVHAKPLTADALLALVRTHVSTAD